LAGDTSIWRRLSGVGLLKAGGVALMQVRQQTQQIQAKKSVSVKTVILVILAVMITVFAFQNWTLVRVWPLGPEKPLTLVIGISFTLGALIGWLGHSILFGRRPLAPVRNVVDEDDR
jgi:uncharacterized membrane protein